MLKACAFDLGNTLVDDARLLAETTAELELWLHDHGHLPRSRPFAPVYMKVNQRNNAPFISHTYGELCFFEDAFRELGVSGLSAKDALCRYRKTLLRNTRWETGAEEALRSLRARGLQTALLTNESTERVQAFFDRTGGRDLFDEVLVSQEVGYEKPDPRFFQEALERLGVQGEELAMFGDNEIADGACRELGIRYVLVTALKRPGWGWERGPSYQPDYRIERVDPDSVIRLLEAGFPSSSTILTED